MCLRMVIVQLQCIYIISHYRSFCETFETVHSITLSITDALRKLMQHYFNSFQQLRKYADQVAIKLIYEKIKYRIDRLGFCTYNRLIAFSCRAEIMCTVCDGPLPNDSLGLFSRKYNQTWSIKNIYIFKKKIIIIMKKKLLKKILIIKSWHITELSKIAGQKDIFFSINLRQTKPECRKI